MEKNYKDVIFPKNAGKKELKRALKKAWQLRDFEIGLYWKRTIYFSTFIGALFVGFYNIRDDCSLKTIIAILGTAISWVWFLTNKGSKFWQENWENHIIFLEQEFNSEIYSVTLNKSGECFFNPLNGHSYSISRLNGFIVLLIWMAWVFLLIKELFFNMVSLCEVIASFIAILIFYIFLSLISDLLFASQKNFSERGQIKGADIEYRRTK